MKIPIPCGSYLFLQEVVEQPSSVLHLPDTVEKTTYWLVAYAGPDATLPAGTQVIPSVKHSTRGRVGDDIYIVTKEEDLLGYIVEAQDENSTEG